MHSEEFETFQSICAETGAVHSARAGTRRCCFEESRDKTLDVAALVDNGNAIIADNDGERIECCYADCNRIRGLEIKDCRRRGSRVGSSGMTRAVGIVERIPARAVRWAGLMWSGDFLAAAESSVPAMFTSRMRDDIRGVTVVKRRCLQRRRIVAPLVAERMSSSPRIIEKPCAAVALVC